MTAASCPGGYSKSPESISGDNFTLKKKQKKQKQTHYPVLYKILADILSIITVLLSELLFITIIKDHENKDAWGLFFFFFDRRTLVSHIYKYLRSGDRNETVGEAKAWNAFRAQLDDWAAYFE